MRGLWARPGWFFFFSSRRRHTRLQGDWSSDVCSSDLCFLYVAIAGAGSVLARVWPLLPLKIQVGLDLALQGAPWLGLATLLYVFRPRSEERRVGKRV